MMRMVSCSQCRKTYDTSSLAPGEAFTCHCGARLQVPTANFDHAADVVRCESCGAPQNAAHHKACQYCGSTFTLHERDLDAICPKCTTRVSSKAQFCQACGTVIAHREQAASITDLSCPACVSEKLYSRPLGDMQVTVMECHACLGYWLSHETFRDVQKKSMADGVVMLTIPGAPSAQAKSTIAPQEALPKEKRSSPFYRHCPVCRDLMNRKNMSKQQGIILDICRLHGVWFDANELANLMAWIQDGGWIHQQKDDAVKANSQDTAWRSLTRDTEKDLLTGSGGKKASSPINLVEVASIIYKLLA